MKDLNIAIVICTLQRPKMLRDCLVSIARQPVPSGCQVTVVVVENDEKDSSSAIVKTCFEGTAFAAIYGLQPERGIPFARNRSVELALQANADWLIFVDDDEEVTDGWLEAMASHARSEKADVYSGPVIYRFDQTTPEWFELGRGVADRKHNQFIETAATNNTLVNADLFKQDGLGLRFNEDMRFTGACDDFLFRSATAKGVRIMWVTDAPTQETVIDERLTLGWNLKRRFRIGANRVHISRGENGNAHTWKNMAPEFAKLTGRALPALAVSLLRMPLNRQKARSKMYRSLRTLSEASGIGMGLMGYVSKYYKVIDGH